MPRHTLSEKRARPLAPSTYEMNEPSLSSLMRPMRSYSPYLSLTALAALMALAVTQIGCGPPKMCSDMSSGGFGKFRSEEWQPFCQRLDRSISDPLSFELIELTEFFASFPERSQELRSELIDYEKPKRCFDSDTAKLEYRRMTRCLVDNEEIRLNMLQAWEVRAKPWVEEYDERVGDLSRELTNLTREADYIEQKLSQKFDFSVPMSDEKLLAFRAQLDEVQPKLEAVDRAKTDYERLAGASMANDQLNRFIEENYAEVIKRLLQDHEGNRVMMARLRARERYFTFATYSVGRPCIEGPKARKEKRVAEDVLAEPMKERSASETIHISQPIEEATAEDGSTQTETFKGFFCAERGPDNQFEDKPTMCSQFTFEITRARPAGERRWGDWQVTSVEEGDVNAGVDCNKLER